MKFFKYLPALTLAVIAGSMAATNASAEEIPTVTEPETIIAAGTTDISIRETSETETTVITTVVTETVTTLNGTETTVPQTTATTTATTTQAVITGWYRSVGGSMYYYDENGEMYTGLHEIDGNVYFFARNGIMKTGWYTLDGKKMYFDNETGIVKSGWLNDESGTYYLNAQEGVLTGIQDIDGKTYIFNKLGVMYTGGWIEYEGNKYYSDENGVLKKGECIINGEAYLFSNAGKFQSGWQTVNGLRLYYDYNTTKVKHGWIRHNGYIYYSDAKNGKYIGDCTVKGDKYRFGQKGYLATGLQTFSDGKRYYSSDGKPQTGILKYNGKTYYFDEKSKIMQTGFQAIKSVIYYFKPQTGEMVYNWQKINNKKYYFGSDGKMATGLQGIDGQVYLFSDRGIMQTGWQNYNSKRYYFGSDGAAYIYRHNIDNVNYCFNIDGSLVTKGNQDIVVKALSQVGNVGGEPYWRWWGFDFRIEWCACFVSWCANQCGFTQDGSVPEFISCAVGISWFKQHNQWYSKNNYTPISGDYIFFDWEPDGVADHIGLVDYCEYGIVYTVEGNSGDRCRRKAYALNDICIFGYARPSYQL